MRGVPHDDDVNKNHTCLTPPYLSTQLCCYLDRAEVAATFVPHSGVTFAEQCSLSAVLDNNIQPFPSGKSEREI